MLHRPTLLARYDARIIPDEGVLLVSDRREHVLSGAVYADLVPLLTGMLTTDEIVDRVPHHPAETYYALMGLTDQGIVAEAGGVPPATAVTGVPATRRAARVRAVVAVRVVGHIPHAACVEALVRHGFAPCEDLALTAATIVFVDDYLRPELDELNREALRASRRWLLVKPLGDEIWVGPLFAPPATGCWRCLEQRLACNHPGAAFLRRNARAVPPLPVPADLALRCATAARLLVPYFSARPETTLAGAVLTCDPVSAHVEHHVLLRRPQCPACGDPTRYARQLAQPIVPQHRRKAFTADGGHRSQTPEHTLRRFVKLLSPVTGVVKSLESIETDRSDAVRVTIASYGGPSPGDGLDAVREHLRRQSSGKGATDAQARCSGLGEAIERCSGTFHGDEPFVVASFNELGDRAIHPNECLLFSDAQFRQRDTWNREHRLALQVPAPFDPARPLAWTPVWSLTRGVPRWLPTMYLYYDYPATAQERCAPADSNGCAAGVTLEDALLQGILELVERDSVALWWYNRISRPAVALESLEDGWCHELTRGYRAMQRELWVLDITADLGIPAFAAVSRRCDGDEQLLLGFGAHLDARLAVRRALTEMSQVLALATAARRAGKTLSVEAEAWLRTATLAGHPYLRPGPLPPRDVSTFRRLASEDFLDDILVCQRLIEQRGMDMLVLDQARPDIGVPVMKVIVPGLRHFWPRFAEGRLYDVPRTLGWLAARHTEADLNPVPMFF